MPLHGFKGFLGGLDNERDLTGELSVYTKFQELEVMFHVSTLLPFSPKDSQQVRGEELGGWVGEGIYGHIQMQWMSDFLFISMFFDC